MTKKFLILITVSLLLFGLVFVFRMENIGTTALWNLSDGGTWLLPLVGVAALIDSSKAKERRCAGAAARPWSLLV